MSDLRGYDDWLIAGEPGNETDEPTVTTADLLLMHLQADHRGRNNAGSREHFCAEVGVSDRAVRDAVEELRARKHVIGNGPRGGYFIADSLTDKQLALAQYDKSLMRRLVVRNRMARCVPDAPEVQLVLVDATGQGRLVS